MTELVTRLSEAGFDFRVEVRDRLAILIPEADSTPGVERRTQILSLAREEGITHVALELDPDGAALSRD